MDKKNLALDLIIILSLVCNSSIGQANQNKGDTNKVVRIERKQNPQGRIVIKQDLVIGLNKESEDFLFSEVLDMQVDSMGNVYVSDMRDKNIKVFDKTGKNLRIIGKKGQGPGEIQSLGGTALVGDDEIMVLDPGNRRLSYFSTSGNWNRSIPMGTNMIGSAVVDVEGNLIAQALVIDEETKQEIIKFDSKLNPLFKIAELAEEGWNDEFVISPVRSRLCYGITREGQIVWGISSKYELNIMDSQGNQQNKIVKTARPLEISSSFKTAIEKKYKDSNIPSNYRITFPKYFPDFSFFVVEESGRIYVRTYWMNKNNEYYHDVFDVRGGYLAQFAIPEGEYISVVKNNKLYCIIRENADGIPLVKRYDLKWSTEGPHIK
jgi:hypothetical protein